MEATKRIQNFKTTKNNSDWKCSRTNPTPSNRRWRVRHGGGSRSVYARNGTSAARERLRPVLSKAIHYCNPRKKNQEGREENEIKTRSTGRRRRRRSKDRNEAHGDLGLGFLLAAARARVDARTATARGKYKGERRQAI
jgi:hypothetical protein